MVDLQLQIMSSDPKFQNTSLEGNPDTPLVHHRVATDTRHIFISIIRYQTYQ